MQQDDGYLAALHPYWKRYQAFPTMTKLCDVVGLSTTSLVFAFAGRLVDAGHLERIERRFAPTKKFFARPGANTVRTGLPQPASQNSVEPIILDGDFVVVKKNSATEPGSIVMAIADGEITVKTLCLDDRQSYFRRANKPAFADILPSGPLEIVSVVTDSFRRYRR